MPLPPCVACDVGKNTTQVTYPVSIHFGLSRLSLLSHLPPHAFPWMQLKKLIAKTLVFYPSKQTLTLPTCVASNVVKKYPSIVVSTTSADRGRFLQLLRFPTFPPAFPCLFLDAVSRKLIIRTFLFIIDSYTAGLLARPV